MSEKDGTRPADGQDLSNASPAPKRKRRAIAAGVVVAVLVVAVAGFLVWHEQPSFCSAICHTPMDPYYATYDQEVGVQGVDKYGKTVANTVGMLAVTHAAEGETCMGCHVPTISEQVNEGLGWVSGNYAYPLAERTQDHLVRARGLQNSDEFCLTSGCHITESGTEMTREDLVAKTADRERNPHDPKHGELSCTNCHKAHRASVMVCTECHVDAEVPEGWITFQEERRLFAEEES